MPHEESSAHPAPGEQPAAGADPGRPEERPQGTAQTLRPASVPARTLGELTALIRGWGRAAELTGPAETEVSGVSMDSHDVQPGDLYVAVPGSNVHGARFCADARGRGAHAVMTDAAGAQILRSLGVGLPVILVERVREIVGPLAGHVYASQPASAAQQQLFAVTGTNGKTTTTYMINSLLEALGRTTGLIGTIEILAGEDRIPSRLTTPESTHVHSLVTVMRERGITAMSMEVSSHALDYRRVDGLVYDVAGFTNLTQDHLDQHGSMEAYFRSKAQLLTPGHARRGVVIVDDAWGEAMAASAREAMGEDAVVTLATAHGAGVEGSEGPDADWTLCEVAPAGIGHRFALRHRDGRLLRSETGMPAAFNVSNAALALAMVAESGAGHEALTAALREPGCLTPAVPGRMQVIARRPASIVDFAHNPDALERALEAVEPAEGSGGRVIVVFGATGQRDQLKRPLMGAIAARHADVVIVTDDDPHHEPPGPIRAAVEAGARRASNEGARARLIENVAPRAAAIRRAVELAEERDAILLAGRGHETHQDVAGVDEALDDREELRAALAERAARIPGGTA